jgi:hypothetical protein
MSSGKVLNEESPVSVLVSVSSPQATMPTVVITNNATIKAHFIDVPFQICHVLKPEATPDPIMKT